MSTVFKLQALFDQEEDQVSDAAGVAPLVVVPADDFAGVAADDFGQERVEDAGKRVAAKVGRDELFVGVAEDAFQRAGGGGLDGGVDGVDGDGLFGDEGEVDDRDIRCGNANGEAVELAGHLGDDELEGFCGSGGAGDHGEGGGAGRGGGPCAGVSRMTWSLV